FSDRGLFFQKPDGTNIFRVPTDGTPISMSASDVQIERAQVDEVDLNVGRVRSGGLFELSSGVTPPASPPELNAAWRRAATLDAPEEAHFEWTGLARWGDKWVRGVNVRDTSVGDRIQVYSNTGVAETSIPILFDPRGGVTVIGDVCYVLGHEHGRPEDERRVQGFDLTTGDRVTDWVFPRFYSTGQKSVAIGNDGSNLLFAGVAPNGTLYAMRYDTSGAQVGSDMTVQFDTGF